MSFFDFDSYIPEDRAVLQVLERARSEAAARVNILITGAKGTGKTSLAHWLQNLHHGPQSLLKIEFRDLHPRLFQSSVKSFLIENIDSWSVIEQKILFDFIENHRNVSGARWIATSKKDLRALARKDLFLPELYYRLGVMHLHLPAVCERAADLERMARFVLDVNGILLNKPSLTLSLEASAKLAGHAWPGNVYEVENVLSRAAALAQDDLLQAYDIEFDGAGDAQAEPGSAHIGMTLSEVEKKLILQTLELTAQNRTRAAEILGISVRTLRNKINEYKEDTPHESL